MMEHDRILFIFLKVGFLAWDAEEIFNGFSILCLWALGMETLNTLLNTLN